MSTTKGKLRSVIKRLIKGGNPSVASSVRDEEINEAIGQCLNKLLKIEYFQVNLPSGGTVPSGYVLACYDSLVVEKYKDRSRVKLPAIPVMLINNIGVFHIGDEGKPDCYYVPVPAGQGQLLKNQPLISNLLGKTSYEIKDGHAVFATDITPKKVDMQLVVMDMSHYGDYDLLPVPADMEEDIVKNVVARFIPAQTADKLVDSSSEPTKFKQ